MLAGWRWLGDKMIPMLLYERATKARRLISPLALQDPIFSNVWYFSWSLLPSPASLTAALSSPGVINPHRILSSINRQIVFSFTNYI